MDYNHRDGELCDFCYERVVILSKVTRYEYEKRSHPHLNDEHLRGELNSRGLSLEELHEKHDVHQSAVADMEAEFKKRNIRCQVVKPWDYNYAVARCADFVISAGGDGTFLLASAKVRNRRVPVIGVNTDHKANGHHLCVPPELTPNGSISHLLDLFFKNEFRWLDRQRIRVTLSGRRAHDCPIELKDHRLLYPECHWASHVTGSMCCPLTYGSPGTASDPKDDATPSKVLDCRALSEVYVGDSVSARTSYYELSLDGGPFVKQKSSGLTVCTGTGSNSWYFSTARARLQTVQELMHLINNEMKLQLPANNMATVKSICEEYNSTLTVEPSDTCIAYTVRDLVSNETFPDAPNRGFAKVIEVKSRSANGIIVLDGGISYVFDYDTSARFEIKPEDALRTVVFDVNDNF